jgi:hypothetical protein
MVLGAVLGAGVEAGSGGDGTASAGSALEAASTLRTRRASGSNVRADTRGTGSSIAHAGRSRSVAARRIRRRRPSGKATAMKRGPRAQRRDRTVRRWPTRGCRGSVTVTAEIRRSAAGAARRVEFAEHLAPLGEAAVGGEDHRPLLVAGVDPLEEKVGPCVREERPTVTRSRCGILASAKGNRPAPGSLQCKGSVLRRTPVRKGGPFARSFASVAREGVLNPSLHESREQLVRKQSFLA